MLNIREMQNVVRSVEAVFEGILEAPQLENGDVNYTLVFSELDTEKKIKIRVVLTSDQKIKIGAPYVNMMIKAYPDEGLSDEALGLHYIIDYRETAYGPFVTLIRSN